MNLLYLVLIPLVAAALAFLTPWDRLRPLWLPLGGAAHLGATLLALGTAPGPALHGWLDLDALSRLFLGLISLLFLMCAVYAPGYLAERRDRDNRVFCAALLAALGTMTLLCLARHVGLLWVAMETTTLASAPLLYFNRNARSLEATWKYLVLGSVGVALALLGSFFLAYAALHGGQHSSLFFEDLLQGAAGLSRPWLHVAFVLLFVGYGTKMGLAPMHSWKPDAYGEAPGIVGTVLAGCVTSCAFLSLLRFYQICVAAGEGAFAGRILVTMGLLSMAVAAVFMTRQRDFKRILAYSSVEHMGILVLGVGLGGGAVFGALLHLVNNGLAKGVLFLSAGNIHRAYGSKLSTEVSGAMRRLPLSGTLLVLGLMAITGSPPFGPFLSELTILLGAVEGGRYGVAVLYLLLLGVIFVGLGSTLLGVAQGAPPAAAAQTPVRDRFTTGAPIVVLMALLTLMGVYIPPPVSRLLREAAAAVERPVGAPAEVHLSPAAGRHHG